jgi:prefoldin subunit 5|tara:strand:+ start:314 stop:529 length:216 start_codon:yes stop_codon:yes gene_type:complete
MAKVTIEMNVDDDTVEEAVGSVPKLMSKFAGLEQANKDMSESLQALAKAISKNNAEIRKLAKELAKSREED